MTDIALASIILAGSMHVNHRGELLGRQMDK
jgi:hypothetical protein